MDKFTPSTATAKKVQVGSFSTRYLEGGEEDASAVILLHDGGHGANAEATWYPIFDLLTGAGYRVLAPDLLGFGETDKAVYLDRAPFEFRNAHIAEFCRKLNVSTAHFVGASFGGTMALRSLEEKSSDWPTKSVTSITGTGGPWRNPEGMKPLAGYDGTREGMAALVGALVSDDLGNLDDYIEYRHGLSMMPGAYEAVSSVGLKNPAKEPSNRVDNYPATIENTDVPVSLIKSTNDPTNLPEWTDNILSKLPSAKVTEFEGRHLPHLEHPDDVVEELLKWFASA